MPVVNGLDAAREIRRIAPSVKIVVFSMHDSAQMVKMACEVGADAFVLKAAPAEMVSVAGLCRSFGPPSAAPFRTTY